MKTLSPAEIGQLERQGCRARDWNTVRIDEKTDLGAIWDVRFAFCLSGLIFPMNVFHLSSFSISSQSVKPCSSIFFMFLEYFSW